MTRTPSSNAHRRPALHPAVVVSHRLRIPGHILSALLIASTLEEVVLGPGLAAVGLAVAWPWLALSVLKRSRDGKKAAYRAMLGDAILAGVYMAVCCFRPFTTITFLIVIGTLNMTMGGLRFFLRTLVAVILGALLALPVAGVHSGGELGLFTLCLGFFFIAATTWYAAFLVNDTTRRFIVTRRLLRSRNEELGELNRIILLVNASLELDEVMEVVMTALKRVFPFDQLGLLHVDATSRFLDLDRQLGAGFSSETMAGFTSMRVPLDEEESVFAQVVNSREQVCLSDIDSARSAGLSPVDRRIFEANPVRGLLLCPLEIQGEVKGIMAFGSSRSPIDLDQDSRNEVQRYVNQMAVAVYNARLFDEAEMGRLAAEEADRVKSSFLTNVGYGLRAPLNAIRGHSEMLLAHDPSTPPPSADLEELRDASCHLHALVEDLLELSGIDSGAVRLDVETIDVEDLVREVGTLVKSRFDSGGRHLEIAIAEDVASLRSDPSKLRRVLVDILTLADRAAEQSGEDVRKVSLNVDLRVLECRMRFAVGSDQTSDSSSWISALERLVLPPLDEKRFSAAGLGLAVSRRLCRLMGGTLEVSNVAGKGASIVVELPLELGDGPVDSRRSEPAYPSESLRTGEVENLGGKVVDLEGRVGSEYLLSRLRTSRLFGAHDDSSLQRVASQLQGRALERGEELLSAGTPGETLFLVLEGRLLITAIDEGRALVLDEVGAGGIVGEIAILTGGYRSSTVRALEPSLLGSLDRGALSRITHEHLETGQKLLQLVAFRLRRGQLARHLDRLFGRIDAETVRGLINDVEWVSLSSGMTLYDGDSQDRAVYVVMHGRLRIEASGEFEAIVVTEASEGDLVGEERLIGGGPSSRVVTAARETQLARLSNELFERLLAQAPRGAIELARSLARVSQRNWNSGSGPSLSTLAVVPASREVGLSECCRQLAAALCAHGSVCTIDSRRADAALGQLGTGTRVGADDPRLMHWLNELERKHDFVLYQSDRTWTPWTRHAVQHADVVLVVGRADRDSRPGEIEEQIRITWRGARPPKSFLLLVHPAATRSPTGTEAWLARRSFDGHFHVRHSSVADYARVARRLTGNAIGLVLGGGGARSFANIGVIRTLEELGIEVDAIGGTSFGACVAAAFAIGNDSRGLARLAKTHFSDSFIDLTLPLVAFLRGRSINGIISSIFHDQRIEDLWIPFFCVSTNLTKGRPRLHQTGSLSRAVRSTIAIPGVVPPVVEGSDLLVDGGLLNNVPADLMRAVVGKGHVLAVDVSPMEDLRGHPELGLEVSGWSLLRQHLAQRGGHSRLPTIANILSRITVVSSLQSRDDIIASGQADLYLKIPTSDFPMMAFSEFEPLIELGYEASLNELQKWLQDQLPESRIA